MDEKDVKIIKILQKNGRLNYNEVASQLKLSNATIHARIIKLKKNGIIDKFTVSVNPKAVGKNISFMLSISVLHEKDIVEDTTKKLLLLDDVVNVWCVTGEWDYHVLFQTRDVDSMKKIVTSEIKKFVPHIQRSSAQIILESREKPLSVNLL